MQSGRQIDRQLKEWPGGAEVREEVQLEEVADEITALVTCGNCRASIVSSPWLAQPLRFSFGSSPRCWDVEGAHRFFHRGPPGWALLADESESTGSEFGFEPAIQISICSATSRTDGPFRVRVILSMREITTDPVFCI